MVSLRSAGPIVFAFVGGVVLTAFIKWPPTQSSDWAAWVQAVGSVAAILGAIWIADEQYKRNRRDVEDRVVAESMRAFNVNLSRLVTIRELMKSTHYLMVEMRSRREEPGFTDTLDGRSRDIGELVDLKILLSDIRLDSLPSYACASALITLRRCVVQLSTELESAGSDDRNWSFTDELKLITDEARSASYSFAEALGEWEEDVRPKALF